MALFPGKLNIEGHDLTIFKLIDNIDVFIYKLFSVLIFENLSLSHFKKEKVLCAHPLSLHKACKKPMDG